MHRPEDSQGGIELCKASAFPFENDCFFSNDSGGLSGTKPAQKGVLCASDFAKKLTQNFSTSCIRPGASCDKKYLTFWSNCLFLALRANPRFLVRPNFTTAIQETRGMMSDQTAVAQVQPVRTEAYLDFLQMLSGVALVMFMWAHMILVASVNLDLGGGRVMNWIAHFFEATYMAQIGGPMIALVMLAHFVLAARKLPFKAREQKEMWRHSVRLNHLDTWLWVIQAVTAFIILIMGCIHMWTVLTDLPITAQKSGARIQGGWWLLFYIFLLPMIELHVGIGAYRIGVKWGWIKRSNRQFFHGLENKITLIFITIGVITLFTFYVLVKPM